MTKGDTQGANAQIDEILKKDKNDRQALLLRARLKAQGRQVDGLKSAMEDLKDVLKQEPNSRPGLYFMAQIFNLGLMDQARAFAADLEKNYPDYLPAKLMQLQITLTGGDQRAHGARYRFALAPGQDGSRSRELAAVARRDSRKTHLVRGGAQLQLKNTAAARQDFETAKQIAQYDPIVYNSLALVSLAENKPQDAIGFFENALSVDATNFDALNGVITLYANNKEVSEGPRPHRSGAERLSKRRSLHFLKAGVYGFEQNGQMVEAELRRAIEIDPNYRGLLFVGQSLHQIETGRSGYRRVPEDRVPAAGELDALHDDRNPRRPAKELRRCG